MKIPLALPALITGIIVIAMSNPLGGNPMPLKKATGTFEVKIAPLDAYNASPDAELGRMSIDKTFSGDLEATSKGEMLSGGSPASGSAGYVAMERVTGTLHGKTGSFTLQHSATMTPSAQQALITVVPASGTGELEGLTGSMQIDIEDGQHFYTFEYELEPQEPTARAEPQP